VKHAKAYQQYARRLDVIGWEIIDILKCHRSILERAMEN